MFIETDAVDALHGRIVGRAPIVMPLVTQAYGMREFAITPAHRAHLRIRTAPY